MRMWLRDEWKTIFLLWDRQLLGTYGYVLISIWTCMSVIFLIFLILSLSVYLSFGISHIFQSIFKKRYILIAMLKLNWLIHFHHWKQFGQRIVSIRSHWGWCLELSKLNEPLSDHCNCYWMHVDGYSLLAHPCHIQCDVIRMLYQKWFSFKANLL